MARQRRAVHRPAEEHLPSGAIIYWERVSRAKTGHQQIVVRCPCGVERLVYRHHILRKDSGFSGLCRRCTASRANQQWSDQQPHRFIQSGYIMVGLPPDHPYHAMANKRGYVYEHRWVVAEHLGRPFLRQDEIVHHLNGIRDDNRLENLQLMVKETQAQAAVVPRGQTVTKSHEIQRSQETRRYTERGYVVVGLSPDHPYGSMANERGYVYEHRLVVAEYLGRPLDPDEVVHHLNGIRDDNRLGNLQLMSRDEHLLMNLRSDHPGYEPLSFDEERWA